MGRNEVERGQRSVKPRGEGEERVGVSPLFRKKTVKMEQRARRG